MLLTNFLREILKRPAPPVVAPAAPAPDDGLPSVLNVGGGSKSIGIPAFYQSWRHLLLDIDPSGEADIVMDARKLRDLAPQSFDAVYCSHNLEHYHLHEVPVVLAGFLHVLKPRGFAEIHVPDMRAVMHRFVNEGLDMHDPLYRVPGADISVHDVMYGWGKEIVESGNDFYAHKTGFTATSLLTALEHAGFAHVRVGATTPLALRAFAFKQMPDAGQLRALGLSTQPAPGTLASAS